MSEREMPETWILPTREFVLSNGASAEIIGLPKTGKTVVRTLCAAPLQQNLAAQDMGLCWIDEFGRERLWHEVKERRGLPVSFARVSIVSSLVFASAKAGHRNIYQSPGLIDNTADFTRRFVIIDRGPTDVLAKFAYLVETGMLFERETHELMQVALSMTEERPSAIILFAGISNQTIIERNGGLGDVINQRSLDAMRKSYAMILALYFEQYMAKGIGLLTVDGGRAIEHNTARVLEYLQAVAALTHT